MLWEATPSERLCSIALVARERYPEMTWKGSAPQGRRPGPGDDLEGVVAVGERLKIEQDVEPPGIDAVHVAGAKVPQQLIYLREAFRLIAAVAEIHRPQ